MPLLAPRVCHHVAIAMLAVVAVAGRSDAMPSRGDSLCARPPLAHDSVRVVVTAIARVDSVNDDHPPHLPPEFLAFVVEAVRTHFVPPVHLDLASMAGGMPHPPAKWLPPPSLKGAHLEETTTPLLAVDAYFNINASGTPGDIRIGRSSMAGALARSVDSAIRAIVPDDYGLVPPGADGARVHFHLEAAPATVATDQPFFSTWLPVYQVEKYPSLPPHAVIPKYPDALRAMGISDTVDVAFAIGADGRVIPGTVDVLAARFIDFADAVKAALTANAYQPLVADGCRLTSTVQETFTFTIGR